MKRWLLAAGILMCGCVRIYVTSPNTVSMVDPPGAKTAKALTDLRTIGTALEAYNVDNNTYPVTNEKDVSVGTLTFANVERLESQLVNYVRHVSPEDGWGSPYLYWSSGKSYVLLSTGSDRLIADQQALIQVVESLTTPRAFSKTTDTECLEDEILFCGGQFLRAPKYSAKECSKAK